MCVACPAHSSNDRVAQRGHDLRDMATAYLGAIFLQGDIPDPMRAVLALPLAANEREQTHGVGLLWCQAREASAPFRADLPRLFDDDWALQPKDLRQTGPVPVPYQHVTRLPLPLLEAAMSQGQGGGGCAPLSRHRGQGKHDRNVLS